MNNSTHYNKTVSGADGNRYDFTAEIKCEGRGIWMIRILRECNVSGEQYITVQRSASGKDDAMFTAGYEMRKAIEAVKK